MFILEDIKQAIAQLSRNDRASLLTWISETEGAGFRVGESAVAYSTRRDFITVEEYLKLEEESNVRHEYVDGVMYAMSGASLLHQRVLGNLLAAVYSHVRNGPCVPYLSGLKLRLSINQEDIFYYPDLMVACTRDGEDKNHIRYPQIVVEVLSPSTKRVDRREKLLCYKEIPTVEEYMLLAQDAHEVIAYRRADKWAPQVIRGADAMVEFRSIGLSLPLTQVYEGLLQ